MMHGFGMNEMAWWFGAHWLTMLLGAVVIVFPFWKIFVKAGFSGWLGLLMIIPMINLIVLYVLAALEVVIAFVVRSRVESRDVGRARGQLHPLTAARVLALAKASAILGAIAVGVWAGLLAFLLGQQDVAAADHDRPGAIVGLIGGVLLVCAAMWLQYCFPGPRHPPPRRRHR